MPTEEAANKYVDEFLELVDDPTKQPPVDDPALRLTLAALAGTTRNVIKAYGMARWLYDEKQKTSIGPQAFIPAGGSSAKASSD